jgi:type II secretory pathway pseudopilin PulG
MSKTAWIVIAVIIVLIIAIVLFRRSQKRKEEEALAAMQAAQGTNPNQGTFADALSALIPVILANTGKSDDKQIAETSNMGTGSTNKAMLGVFGGTGSGIDTGKLATSTTPDWQGMCKCGNQNVWAKECCQK